MIANLSRRPVARAHSCGNVCVCPTSMHIICDIWKFLRRTFTFTCTYTIHCMCLYIVYLFYSHFFTWWGCALFAVCIFIFRVSLIIICLFVSLTSLLGVKLFHYSLNLLKTLHNIYLFTSSCCWCCCFSCVSLKG